MALRSISLCSGVGGLDLGVELGLGRLRPLCYVEREVAAARILAQRMEDQALPAAPIWSDITTFDGSRFDGMVDLVTAGFPCPDYSVAGKREGRFGKHGQVWDHVIRIICEVGPGLVVLENVPGILVPHAGGDEGWVLPAGLHFVLGDLAESGFDAEWLCVRASDVGAPHRRERWFCVAYRKESGREASGLHGLRTQQGQREGFTSCGDPQDGIGRGLAHAAQRGLGVRRGPVENAERDRCGPRWTECAGQCGGIAFDGAGMLLFPPGPGDAAAWRPILERWPWLAPAVKPGVVAYGEGWDGAAQGCQLQSGEGQHQRGSGDIQQSIKGETPPQPGLRGLAHGTPLVVDESRADQLRALGNGVVPLQAAVAIRELLWRIRQ